MLMNTSRGVHLIKKTAYNIEWKLLIFLILFMDVKLAVKAAALILTYILQPDFRFGFKMKDSRLPLFYLLIIGITLLNFILYPNLSGNYGLVLVSGILIWLACILAIHQLRLFVDRTDITILHNTLLVFFIFNITFSIFNLSAILLEIGIRNPFLYQGQFQKYFISTGDYIKGITADTSTTNAVINCFGVIYFLYRKKYPMVIACMVTLLLTASNFSIFVLLFPLTGIFFLKSNRDQKSIISICLILGIIFFGKISPQNKDYVTSSLNKFVLKNKDQNIVTKKIIPLWARPDSLLTAETRREKTAVLWLDSVERARQQDLAARGLLRNVVPYKKPVIPEEDINTAPFQARADTTIFQHQMLSYFQRKAVNRELKFDEASPGKMAAFDQSVGFFKNHPDRILSGEGIGNFSSKLAFRATGLNMAGSFPGNLTYSNSDFLNNHFRLFVYFFEKPAESHSLMHNPASVYDQLLTEYGLLGIVVFAFYYIGFFIRHRNSLSYGLPALFLLLAFFVTDYWFEQLSIVVLFELIMFTDIKEHTQFVKRYE